MAKLKLTVLRLGTLSNAENTHKMLLDLLCRNAGDSYGRQGAWTLEVTQAEEADEGCGRKERAKKGKNKKKR